LASSPKSWSRSWGKRALMASSVRRAGSSRSNVRALTAECRGRNWPIKSGNAPQLFPVKSGFSSSGMAWPAPELSELAGPCPYSSALTQLDGAWLPRVRQGLRVADGSGRQSHLKWGASEAEVASDTHTVAFSSSSLKLPSVLLAAQSPPSFIDISVYFIHCE